ncbi:hypothetical protein HAHE_27800 [Haloferula helveola]|uniref:Uncharacterized protein n=1 Tax=Haloferula helveola TaxID=490095 RepID=A0ABN6H7E7_9BACT|nr:hypothetical protein HAHE_27800 [Haloferula helveola]
MKHILIPVFAALAIQTGLAGTAQKPQASQPLRPSEEAAVMEKAKELLERSIRIDRDGKAVSHFVRKNREFKVEWRNLVFRQLIMGSVSTKDLERGVRRRIYAQISSDAYQLSSPEGVEPWRSGHCPGFPGFVLIEEIHGEFQLSSPALARFTPEPPLQRPLLASREPAVANKL